MTIPTLSVKIRGKQLQSQFLKAYSDLNQAARNYYVQEEMSVIDADTFLRDTTISSSNNSDHVLDSFMKYYNGNHKMTNVGWNPYYRQHNITVKNLNGKTVSNYQICDESSVATDMAGRIYATDNINGASSSGLKICVDVNGISKPNQWGVDMFVFVFTDTNSVIPYTGTSWNGSSSPQTDETVIKQYCSIKTSTPVHTCAYFALQNKSPDGNGDYWTDFVKGK